MSFKKLITLLTASIIALSITACGDSESGLRPIDEANDTTSSETIVEPSSSSVADTSAKIPPVTGTGLLIDDLEDGDGSTLIESGWYTYDDHDNGGASVITTPNVTEKGDPLPTATDNGSAALAVSATGTRAASTKSTWKPPT